MICDKFEFLCGERSERRCGRLENWVFLTPPLFELVYPDLAVSRDFREAFACLLHFELKGGS